MLKEAVTYVNLGKKGVRQILIVVLTDRAVNIGIIYLQMQRYAPKIKQLIEASGSIKYTLKISEQEIKRHIQQFKQLSIKSSLETKVKK